MSNYLDDAKSSEVELLDLVTLADICKRAFYNVCVENGCNIPEGETYLPGNDYSNLRMKIYELFGQAVEDGMALQRSLSH